MTALSHIALASSTPWPLIVVAVAAASALCLWALFRRGSIADRARSDEGHSTSGE